MYSKFLTFFFVAAGLFAAAQNTIHSPFSSYGFGERTYGTDAVTSALGQSNAAFFDSTFLNLYNPSTYNTLSQGQPLFSVGVRGKISEFTQNSSSYTQGLGMVDHFAMAFTLKKHFGLAFGLKPYSRRGYEITETEKVGTDSIRYQYLGSGGSNEVFLGLSSTILKFKGSHLSVGGNLGYLFGTAVNERKSSLIDNESYVGGVDRKTIRFSSFHYELGAYFRQDIGKRQTVLFGATLEPAQEIRSYRGETLYFAGNVNNVLTYSTLYDTINVEGSLTLAPSYTLGLSYSFRTSTNDARANSRNSEWLVTGSYSSTDWTQFSSRFNDVSESYDYAATSKISVGLQYTPEYKFLEEAANTKFFERLRYRIGYYNFNLPYTESGMEVKEFGTTFGIGMPITAQQALSSLNLSVTLGKKGNGQPEGFNEKFIGINFGLIVSPSKYDQWFKKRKLD